MIDPSNITPRKEVISNHPATVADGDLSKQGNLGSEISELELRLRNPIGEVATNQRLTELREALAQKAQTTPPPSKSLENFEDLFNVTSLDPDSNR